MVADSSALKLALAFDPARLVEALTAVPPDLWVRHFNAADFDGDWSGVALRSSDGSPGTITANPSAGTFADTRLLHDCPYFSELLRSFECPLMSVRLLNLRAGSVIREHCDPGLAREDGWVRLHIPIQTNEDVDFRLEGRRIVMRAGECWYLNLSRPHAVRNRGTTDRIHLVIDGVVNPWLLDELARAVPLTASQAGSAAAGSEPTGDDFDAFRARVLTDDALQRELRETVDRRAFDAAAIRIATDLGYSFTTADIDTALRSARRTWTERTRA
jgi:hypothetical protein